MPSIASGSNDLMKIVLDFFLKELKPNNSEQFNIFENAKSLFMLNGFSEFIISIPSTEVELRDLIFQSQILSDAISYLFKLFPLNENHNSEKWQSSVEVPCLPMLLKTLTGMVLCHKPTQELFIKDDSSLIRLLLQLENATSSSSIGEYAKQTLNNAIIEPSKCIESIQKIKEHQIQDSKQRAKAEKEKALKKAKDSVSSKYLEMLDELDEQSFECCICKEGYEFLPNELLGVYVYSNKIDDYCSTATYFVCVHQSCHQKSTSENSGKLSEWEAAIVRNCEHPCNDIFPLPSYTISTDKYKQVLTHYLENKSRKSKNYFNMIFLDVKHHLTTIASGGKIPTNVGGGSQCAILQLLPFLIYGGHLYLQGENRHTYESNLQALIDTDKEPEESLILSIWLLSLEEWESIKILLLKQLLKKITFKKNEDDLFSKFKYSFILFIIINRIQKMIKVKSNIQSTLEEEGLISIQQHHESEGWLSNFFKQINYKAYQLTVEWSDFNGEIEEKIMKINDLHTAFIYSDINDEPNDFISSIIQ